MANKITGSLNTYNKKYKCSKFYFPKAINRVNHGFWKVKAKYIY